MLATIATLVFAPLVSATAACTATAVIGTSLRDALPACAASRPTGARWPMIACTFTR